METLLVRQHSAHSWASLWRRAAAGTWNTSSLAVQTPTDNISKSPRDIFQRLVISARYLFLLLKSKAINIWCHVCKNADVFTWAVFRAVLFVLFTCHRGRIFVIYTCHHKLYTFERKQRCSTGGLAKLKRGWRNTNLPPLGPTPPPRCGACDVAHIQHISCHHCFCYFNGGPGVESLSCFDKQIDQWAPSCGGSPQLAFLITSVMDCLWFWCLPINCFHA